MAFYDDMQGIATQILGQFSQGVINYVKIVSGNGPVDNPGAPTLTRYVCKGVASGISFKYVSMGLAVASDMQAIIAVDSRFVPAIKDMIEIDGIQFKIVQILPKPSAGTPVANLLIIRRGGA